MRRINSLRLYKNLPSHFLFLHQRLTCLPLRSFLIVRFSAAFQNMMTKTPVVEVLVGFGGFGFVFGIGIGFVQSGRTCFFVG